MPYIKEERRRDLEIGVDYSGDGSTPLVSGELNFRVMETITEYLITHPMDYNTLNEIMGVLECVKQEFYRRVVVPYEDKKIKENGDLWQFKEVLKSV